jgi:hypothetical protein
MTPRGL